MWRKLRILLIAVIGITAIGNVTQSMLFTIHGYTPNFQLSKGAKIILGEYNNDEQVWDVGKVDANELLLLSTTGLGKFPMYDDSIRNTCSHFALNNNYTYCPTTMLSNELINISFNTTEISLTNDAPFLPTVKQVMTGGSLGLTVEDREFKDDTNYWLEGIMNIHGYGSYGYQPLNAMMLGKTTSMVSYSINKYLDTGNTLLPLSNRINHHPTGGVNMENISKENLRPFMTVSSNISFAAPKDYTDGSLHTYTETVGEIGRAHV